MCQKVYYQRAITIRRLSCSCGWTDRAGCQLRPLLFLVDVLEGFALVRTSLFSAVVFGVNVVCPFWTDGAGLLPRVWSLDPSLSKVSPPTHRTGGGRPMDKFCTSARMLRRSLFPWTLVHSSHRPLFCVSVPCPFRSCCLLSLPCIDPFSERLNGAVCARGVVLAAAPPRLVAGHSRPLLDAVSRVIRTTIRWTDGPWRLNCAPPTKATAAGSSNMTQKEGTELNGAPGRPR